MLESMSCQRAYETDLAAFVTDPSAESFASFREHYPACSECATEVRVWTELEARLRAAALAAHPEASELLEYEQSNERMTASRRDSIEAHLARCASCTDELGALRSFDFGALAPEPPEPGWLDRLRSRLEGARSVVLHPAFAYALVLALIYPAASSVITDLGRLRPSERRRPLSELPAPSASLEQLASAEQLASDDPKVALAKRKEGAALKQVSRDEFAAQPAGQRRVPAEPMSDATLSGAPDKAERAQLESLGAAESESPSPAPSAVARDREAFAARAAPEPREAAPTPGFDPASSMLVVPIPVVAEAGDRADVRVLSGDGRREFRERIDLTAGDTRARLALPAEWLSTGRYRVEVRLERAGAQVDPAASFAFDAP
jgi:hypothetical protein